MMFKKNYKNWNFSTFLSKTQKLTIFNGYYLVQVSVIIWSKFGVPKKANLDQIITTKVCARNCFSKNLLKPLLYSAV